MGAAEHPRGRKVVDFSNVAALSLDDVPDPLVGLVDVELPSSPRDIGDVHALATGCRRPLQCLPRSDSAGVALGAPEDGRRSRRYSGAGKRRGRPTAQKQGAEKTSVTLLPGTGNEMLDAVHTLA